MEELKAPSFSPYTVICIRCSKRVDEFELDYDPVLFRQRLSVWCHGETAVLSKSEFEVKPGNLITVFGGDDL